MVRTLMDKRYYYGIRQEAAYVLTKVLPYISLPKFPLIPLSSRLLCAVLTTVRDRVVELDRRTPSPPGLPENVLFRKFVYPHEQ